MSLCDSSGRLLEVQQVDSTRMCLVRAAISDIYKVNLVESDATSLVNDDKSGTVALSTEAKSEHGRYKPGSGCLQVSSSPTSVGQSSAKQHKLPLVTLCLEGDVSAQDIEQAKKFASIHLLPGTDYTRSSHQLENRQEFNMVLESSHNIQKTTTALLTFNPECLEVTLQGPANAVASSRSKVVMLLDKLREQARSDNNIHADVDFQGTHHFYEDLLFDEFLEKENSNSSELAHILLSQSHPTQVSNLKQDESCENCRRPTINNVHQHKKAFQNQNQPNWNLALPDSGSFEDVECDTALSPIESAIIGTTVPNVIETQADPFRKVRSVSPEDDNECDSSILTDIRYSKKIEQALKLGYTETNVTKALSKLGPDCALNDLLSELIQLGASDTASPEIVMLEADNVFPSDALDFENCQRQKLHTITSESEDVSSFSSSADSYNSSHIDLSDSNNLRDIIIDGSNVAMSHGKKVFSCKGIQIVVDWFRKRGHKNITAFVPQWRKETSRPDAPITDQEILTGLEKEGIVVFTPARRVKGRRVVCYDDRYVLKLAVETDGIVVSNDVYRDLVNEREDFRRVVEQRLLMYSFANDRFMPPEDPLGRLGPTLDNFLRKVPAEPAPRPPDCPYGKKCTYGNKCRFYHPERGFAPQKLITDTLKEQADLKLQERATRLSEIAEKTKRSKQKLSRTKSLNPWEPLPPALTSQVSVAKQRQEKPKLTHSKSVVLPVKSSDYLNEPRRKLEEAELASALSKTFVSDASCVQQLPTQAAPCGGEADRSAQLRTPSPRSSPSPQKDLVKQALVSTDVLPRHPLPVKSVTTVPSRLSPSHLTVPKSEPPERYLSGHLYLAKKLSDESVESNFFSEHTSSPSSRTSSPAIPSSKGLEQTQYPAGDAHSRKRKEDIPGLFNFPPPLYSSMTHPWQPVHKSQAENEDLENIPNLSIFEQGISEYSPCPDTSVKHGSLEHTTPTEGMFFQKLNPCSPDSGLYTSSESILSPYYQPEYPQSSAYPLFRTDQPPQVSEHLSLRRAFSSTGSFRAPEDFHQKLDRRASGFSSSNFVDENYLVKPQIVPGVDKSAVFSFGHLHGLNRQNSSSDPQIHSGSGDMKDSQSFVYSPADPTRNTSDMYVAAGQHNLMYQQQQQHRQTENQQLRHRLQQQQLHQQQKQDALSCHLSKPTMVTWVEHPDHRQINYRSSLDAATLNHYNTIQNQPIAYRANQVAHPQPPAGSSKRLSAGVFTCTPQHIPQPAHYSQQPYICPTQLDPAYVTEHRRQSFPSHPTYAHPQKLLSHTNQIFPSCNPTQTLPGHSPPQAYILPEDAPITPEDPRYIIYYHLSNVFGEQVVRRVMNLYPNERSPDDVCKLIIQYKTKTGI